MNKKQRGGRREGAGRKRTLPEGAKPTSFQLTEAERIAVKEYIKRLRTGEPFDGAVFYINMKLNVNFG